MEQTLTYQLLDGKATSQAILGEIRKEIEKWQSAGRKVPHLAAVLVGNDGASQTYVNSKVRHCQETGFGSSLFQLAETTTQSELLALVEQLNNDDNIDGYIVQLPLPKHIDEQIITRAILPEKDVDGFHPANVGKLVLGLPTFVSATPNGVMELIKHYKIETAGKHCVVIGRSNIVGTPMSILMSRNTLPGNCTVTLCHSRTVNLKAFTLQADILIVAIGKPEFITADMVKPGVVVIDVGIHRLPDASKKSGFRLVGDVKFDEVAPKTSYISPVPGGVGLMTICSLLQNTLKAARR